MSIVELLKIIINDIEKADIEKNPSTKLNLNVKYENTPEDLKKELTKLQEENKFMKEILKKIPTLKDIENIIDAKLNKNDIDKQPDCGFNFDFGSSSVNNNNGFNFDFGGGNSSSNNYSNNGFEFI